PGLGSTAFRTGLAVPMLKGAECIGVLGLWRSDVRPFTDSEIDLIHTFADQAVIAIENVRLFKELEAKNRDLSESLEQQTATAEILRVISQSPTDTQPVFDAIVGNAARLCNAVFTVAFRFDGEMLHIAALSDLSPEEVEAYQRMWPAPPRRD